MESSNRMVAQQFSQGNFEAVFPFFSEAIEWNIIGNETVKSKIAVIDFCKDLQVEMTSAALTNDNFIESENQIVIEGKCRYFDTEGKAAFVHYCDIYRFENNQIKTITSYCI